MAQATQQPDLPRTPLGAPCSPNWDEAWIQRVAEAEAQHDRPICGAHLRDGTPCTLAPNHENGRCRFHGGFHGTGAQPGNKNARVHGLYERQLLTCGPHCPRWKHCPLAGPDIEALPESQRPTCPYERDDFQTILEDLEQRAEISPYYKNDPLQHHLRAQIAITIVLTARAAGAMAVTPLETPGKNPTLAPAIHAYLRFAKETRTLLPKLPNIPPLQLKT